MGPIEKNLIRQCRRFKEPLPDRIANKPRLGVGLDLFLQAFYDLEHDRNWLSGNFVMPLPITWDTLYKYTEVYELTGTLRDDLLYFVRELDTAYMKHLNKRSS